MNPELLEKAERLAELPYTVEVTLDETTEGDPVYVARVPELEGCLGQGYTIEQAIEDLQKAKVDYIASLLEDGLALPRPALLVTTTSSPQSATFTLSYRHEESSKPTRVFEGALLTQ